MVLCLGSAINLRIMSQNLELSSKKFFTIGEVAKFCKLKPHVLRYWESEFEDLQPVKRRGNRRFYQRQEILFVMELRDLLHKKGFTIQGAKQYIAGDRKVHRASRSQLADFMISDLNELKSILNE